MINKDMKTEKPNDESLDKQIDEKIDDTSGVYVEEFIKIFDPDSGEVQYEGRG